MTHNKSLFCHMTSHFNLHFSSSSCCRRSNGMHKTKSRRSNSISSLLVIHLFVDAPGEVNLHDLFCLLLYPFEPSKASGLERRKWKIIFTQIIVKVTNTRLQFELAWRRSIMQFVYVLDDLAWKVVET
jgi:hypothetical protein